ncbi:type VI secretion system protein TssL, long form [Acidimangrovimonas sediminis]|uniref:type VI secretion system protein TssL, long form n=1 Tax=Acidimangrovimonas sediminis TaxID=2056283 RepID=UPI001E434457|nr:type VI secretion system protein TssL, long form [Acidimangrovimonas sediminis]
MSSDGPKKPPQRTVLRPMPGSGAGGGGQGGGHEGGQGGGLGGQPPGDAGHDPWGAPAPQQPPQQPAAPKKPAGGGQRTVIGQMPPLPPQHGGPQGGGQRSDQGGWGQPPAQGGGFGGQDFDSWGSGQGGSGQGSWGQPPSQGGWEQPPQGNSWGQPAEGPTDWGQPSPPPHQPGQGYGGQNYGGQSQGGQGDSPFDSFSAPTPPEQGGHWLGQAGVNQDSFFPEQRRPEPAMRAPARKIALEEALKVRTAGISAEVNPITAAAAGLLILFGQLRSQIVEMQAVPLMTHVTDEIQAFEKRALAAGVDPQDAMVAKYCLCGTADDIVQNLPGTDRGVWMQYSMVARFFNRRTSGVGFFQEVEKALVDPARKYYLLELMLTCLQLGFEGQYRGMPGGDVELQRVRRRIYETLRTIKPRGDDDISPRWKGLDIAMRRTRGGLPVWVAVCIAAAILVGAYIGMRQFITADGDALAQRVIAVNPRDQVRILQIATVPTPPAKPYKAPEFKPPPGAGPTQLQRVEKALGDDIKADKLTVAKQGEYIAITLNNLVLFASGSAETKGDFGPIGGRIAAALDGEKGKILIVGHTDNVPLSGRGRFKNNFDLSVARAKSVSRVIAAGLKDPARIEVQGKGSDEPIADNKTAEGRAKNRRVEILLQREETLDPGKVVDTAAAADAAGKAATPEGK